MTFQNLNPREILESTLIQERSWRVKRRVVDVETQKRVATGGQMRSMAGKSSLGGRIKKLRTQLNRLLAQEKKQYGNRARMAALTKKD